MVFKIDRRDLTNRVCRGEVWDAGGRRLMPWLGGACRRDLCRTVTGAVLPITRSACRCKSFHTPSSFRKMCVTRNAIGAGLKSPHIFLDAEEGHELWKGQPSPHGGLSR